MALNIYDFSDKLVDDEKLRRSFIERYIIHLVSNLDTMNIVEEWKETKRDLLYGRIYDGADTLIEEVARRSPEFLEKEFDVDTSLVS